MSDKQTFESSYPAYPFAAFVDLGLALSRLYLRARRPQGDALKAEAEAAEFLR